MLPVRGGLDQHGVMKQSLKKAVVRVEPRWRTPSSNQLRGLACIDCGESTPPLGPAGHVYTHSGRSRLGWAVVACAEHVGGAA